MKKNIFILSVLCFQSSLLCMDTDPEGERTARDIQVEVEMNRQKIQKRAACFALTIGIAGLVCDILTIAMAPATGNTAVDFNTTGLSGCTITEASNCGVVVNPARCNEICDANLPRSDNSNLFSATDCFMLQSCPSEAEPRILQAAGSLATRLIATLGIGIMSCWIT